ncbi:hypothetical protein P4H67_02330 [Paenibacillus lautus]|uniref:hypothetical protein n=1 Tax=Paenibacillus lautus TaxID=1401 RepID=UPI002DBC43CF|nr:hypothetical protein [Paenibacillus lautus]MEC0305603.1 hypothetical protein [Paenibacillus lautus]
MQLHTGDTAYRAAMLTTQRYRLHSDATVQLCCQRSRTGDTAYPCSYADNVAVPATQRCYRAAMLATQRCTKKESPLKISDLEG